MPNPDQEHLCVSRTFQRSFCFWEVSHFWSWSGGSWTWTHRFCPHSSLPTFHSLSLGTWCGRKSKTTIRWTAQRQPKQLSMRFPSTCPSPSDIHAVHLTAAAYGALLLSYQTRQRPTAGSRCMAGLARRRLASVAHLAAREPDWISGQLRVRPAKGSQLSGQRGDQHVGYRGGRESRSRAWRGREITCTSEQSANMK